VNSKVVFSKTSVLLDVFTEFVLSRIQGTGRIFEPSGDGRLMSVHRCFSSGSRENYARSKRRFEEVSDVISNDVWSW
jgi:hypothetical protein